MFDQYGRPLNGDYGNSFGGRVEPAPPGPNASTFTQGTTLQQMGGQQPGQPAWYRMAFFPTAPFYSTRPDVGYQTRFYSEGITGETANSEVLKTIKFDIPVRIIAINASAIKTDGSALPVGWDPRDTFLFRIENSTGDRLHVSSRLGSTVCGSMGRPGELGGAGFTVNAGGSVTMGITPLLSTLRIDVTLHCLEIRGPGNFSQ